MTSAHKMMESWSERAEWMQEQLYRNYWNEADHIMSQWFPQAAAREGENFYYWWQAHVIDVWVDGYERTNDSKYLDWICRLATGLKKANGGSFLHNYYDDMEWTALALLRVYDVTGDESFKDEVMLLWQDIQSAWNDHMGGGMAWKKDQLDYKNTPANAPAAILAARLYQRFGRSEDLTWSIRIYDWNRRNLVDPETGFVWDGMNRLGDGLIDKDWKFTYCQGVVIGAALELFRCTGLSKYVEEAERTAHASKEYFTAPGTFMLLDEGIDDTGLFKGIFVRYIAGLIEQTASDNLWREILLRNGEALWGQGMDKNTGIVGCCWQATPSMPVQLSVQLSGVMLIEALARLDH